MGAAVAVPGIPGDPCLPVDRRVAPCLFEQEVVGDRVVAEALVDEAEAGKPAAPRVAARLREQGVLISVLGPTALRAVTHLDVSEADCAEAGRLLAVALT